MNEYLEHRKQGLRNFAVNINGVMKKLHNGQKLHPDENKQIVQYYLESISVLEAIELEAQIEKEKT
jgi:hypothetical protein